MSKEGGEHEKEGGWVLHYWPPPVGRSDFVRLLFEAAGVSYKEFDDLRELLAVYIRREVKQTGFPAFAVPVIMRGPFSLSQTPVICKYLGRRYGMYPKQEEDQWHADAVNLTIHDFFGEISRDTTSEEFIQMRIPHYMSHFEELLKYNEEGQSRYLFGEHMTYVDLALFQVLRMIFAKYPAHWDIDVMNRYFPLTGKHFLRIRRRSNIDGFLNSRRSKPLVIELRD